MIFSALNLWSFDISFALPLHKKICCIHNEIKLLPNMFLIKANKSIFHTNKV